jgi:hypothetical protein
VPKLPGDDIGARETWIQERLGERKYRQLRMHLAGALRLLNELGGGWDALDASGQRRLAACRGTDYESCRRSHSATARAITKTTASRPQSEVTQIRAPRGWPGSVIRCQALREVLLTVATGDPPSAWRIGFGRGLEFPSQAAREGNNAGRVLALGRGPQT